MLWDYEKEAQRAYNSALAEYDEKIMSLLPEETDLLSKEDVIEERERQAKTPAQKVVKSVVDSLSREYDPVTASDSVKQAVIARRKDIEELNSSDSIYINNIEKDTDRLAQRMAGQRERDDEVSMLLRQVERRLNDRHGVTGKELREAIPFLIESDLRLKDIVSEGNERLDTLGSPARLTSVALRDASTALDALREVVESEAAGKSGEEGIAMVGGGAEREGA